MNAPMNITRVLAAAALATAALLQGCWDEPNFNQQPDGSTTTQPGFTVAVTDANSPINGAKVEVPENAVVASETVTIGYQDALPAALNAETTALGGQQISKVLIIERTGKADFGKTVDVTMPYDKAALPADATPIAVYWDEENLSYSPIAIKSIDRAAGRVTFMTAHASKYIIIFINPTTGGTIDPSKLGYNVGFKPAEDSFFLHNFGSYDVPGGNSFGMAGYAAWYHFAKKSKRSAGLRTLYLEGNQALEEDDQVARELISRAYQAGDQKAHIAALDIAAAKGTDIAAQNSTALTVIQQLIVTKQAQLMAVGKGSAGAWTDGSAIVVYGYDSTALQFLAYDPNFPGEVITLPWKPDTGFGATSKNKTYDVFAFASFNSAYSSKTLQSLYDAAEAGFPVSVYPKMTIQSPSELSAGSGIYQVASDDAVTITGSVPRPAAADPTAQRWAHVYLNGVRQPAAYPLDQGSNTFQFTIAKLPTVSGTDVMILVSETQIAYAGWGSGAAWAGGFHAFKQIKVRVANQYFFQNLGFETGDFMAWDSEMHIGLTGTPTRPSPDSLNVGAIGFDRIATDLQVPLFGGHAARVNDEMNGFHISTLTQAAVVPTGKNPVLRFYWSAVLEDPEHTLQQQPYVEIVVQNKTKNLELYRKKFYSNDPSYTGWRSYQGGDWKSIPWQLVELSMAQYAGDNIELKVEAADCALGGHGGYAYLDVDE